MDLNFASMAEAVRDALPDELALVHGPHRRTWTEVDDRAARLAAGLASYGVSKGATVASYLFNSAEYLEGVIATFKIRGVPANVNYRYLEDELHYLLDNADAEALIFHSSLGEHVARVVDRLPKLKVAVQVDDGGPGCAGAVGYEELIAAHEPAPRITRSGEDILLLYTGGTTGMPKGVMWRTCDLLANGIKKTYGALGLPQPTSAADAGVAAAKLAALHRTVLVPASPLMHGTGFGSALGTLLFGGAVVVLEGRAFDAHELWRTVERERVTQICIVGDPFAKPMVKALEEAEAGGRPYDISSLRLINSSGAMWSAPVKQALLDRGAMTLQDGLASSEALAMGQSVMTRDATTTTARFGVGEHATVLTDDGRELEPGSDEVGMLAVKWPIPLGYYKDPEKSARTFRTVNDVRYSIPGDFARVEADGTITLLGRGSVCINTGGEKVFPEEVEEVLKEHPAVRDAIVVGVPDDRWGEAVTAVVAVEDEGETTEAILSFLKTRLAGYKRPKRLVVVADTPRGPNGKADYAEARRLASAALV